MSKQIILLFVILSLLGSAYYVFSRKASEELVQKNANKCQELVDKRGEYLDCWYDFFSEILVEGGVRESLEILENTVSTHKITKNDCHLFADQIGTEAYWSYQKGEKFNLKAEPELCDFGFFHGYVSELMSHGSFAEARDFCQKYKTTGEIWIRQCYVGLGNGLAFYYWDQKKNSEEIIGTSIKNCKEVPADYEDRCIWGVFSGVDHLYHGLHGPKLELNLKDPFSVCRKQSGINKLYCYERTVPALVDALNYDYEKIFSNIQKIREPEIRDVSVYRIGVMIAERDIYKKIVISESFKACDFLSNSDKIYCERGILSIHLLNSTDKAKFCDEQDFGIRQKELCYEEAKL